MTIEIGAGITIGPGITIGNVPLVPVINYLVSESGSNFVTETNDTFIEG